MVDEKAPTLDQLKAELRKVLNTDPVSDAEMVRLTKAIAKHSADVVKAEADKVKKEGEALAGDREKLAKEIWEAASTSTIPAKLAKVKATGYTFKLDDGDLKYKSVSLTVPIVRKSGGGGGGTGVTVQSQTGLRRGELVDKYATDVEKASIQAAEDKATTSKGSAKWAAEKPVVKRILADNPTLIKK